MNKTDGELARKKTIGFLWLCLVCFFNTVPLFIISILANLDSVQSTRTVTVESYPDINHLTVTSIRPIPAKLVRCERVLIRVCLWCVATRHLRSLWLLPAHHYAMVDQGT